MNFIQHILEALLLLQTAVDSAEIRPSTKSTTTIPSQLAVACYFLGWTNLTECRAATSFDKGTVVGTTIPTEIGLLTQLSYLDVHGNPQLTASIPSTLGKLTQLNTLILSKNQLNGTIPSTLGNLTQLNFLSLNRNQLTGTIPSTLASLTLLDHLSVSLNQLTGTIPSTLASLTQLNDLDLYNNQLTGTIPSTLGGLTQLYTMRLYSNAQLAGTIPSTLCSAFGIYIFIDCADVACTCCTDVNFDICPSSQELPNRI